MRVVLWCTAAALLLGAVVATPAQAGFPPCRDATVLAGEYMDGKYVRINGPVVEFWREWNGYAGLQTHKCETEYGVILGRDTFDTGVDTTRPGDQDPGIDPDVPPIEVPEPEPELPGICRSGDDPTVSDIIRACTDRPPGPPSVVPSLDCEPDGLSPMSIARCFTDADDPPAAAYVNWLQFVIGWTTGG